VSVRPSVCPVDRQQQRRAAGLPMSVGAGSRYRSIAAGAAYLSILLQANSKCGQRHVESRSRRLSTELFVGSHVIRVLCAVDSTISSGLNSLAAVCLQDLLRLLCFKDMSEKRATLASKLICMYTSLPSAIFHFFNTAAAAIPDFQKFEILPLCQIKGLVCVTMPNPIKSYNAIGRVHPSVCFHLNF